MQGFERAERQFLDAAALAGHLVPAGSMFAFLAADPDTGIITGEKLTKAAGTENSDSAVVAEFAAAEAAGADGGKPAWYGDSAYGTGELRQAISEAGHEAVIKPWPAQPAVEGGFTREDFTIDQAARTVTCPAGITRQITARNAVIFGTACRSRPLGATAFNMDGNLAAEVAVRHRAEPGGPCAATGRPPTARASPSSTPSSTTTCSGPWPPPTSRKPRPRDARH